MCGRRKLLVELGLLTAESMWHQKVFTDQDSWTALISVRSLDDGASIGDRRPIYPTELRGALEHPSRLPTNAVCARLLCRTVSQRLCCIFLRTLHSPESAHPTVQCTGGQPCSRLHAMGSRPCSSSAGGPRSDSPRPMSACTVQRNRCSTSRRRPRGRRTTPRRPSSGG